ncbi:MAG: PD40 domain-containing protein, partial [Candidatus Eisenbacteria sp.]|nr:PD40 domain-containing protein [Candidatus Eisenbacteria bacterium]
MSITNNHGTLPQRAINITVLITVLFWFPLTVLAATSTLNDYNPHNVNIPDNGSSVNSDLALSGAPSGATITKVKVYYEIRHTYIGDLKVWLTTYYDGAWHDFVLKNREGGSTDNIIETRDNLTTWNGASPNQTWYLVAQDMATGHTGYIDFFELWVTYSVNDPPNTPSSEDPSDGATGVSINKDLDWSCSDPNSDTLYYTVYFEKNDSSPDNVIKSDATGSAADPGTLDYDAHYYWQVKADDHKGGVTWSPVWDFYTESEPVIDASITVAPIGTVQAGDSISISYDVTNDGNVDHAFGVGAEIWKDGVKQDDVGSQTTASVSPGGTKSGSFSYDIPSTWSGTYIARCAVWSGTPGSSTWLDSYDRSFTVNPEPLSLNGRIAYHTYSKYMAVPGGGDTTDGQMFVYDCGADSLQNMTASLPLVNAMNPHFSPDGARLVFMAVPEAKAGDTEYDSTEGYWHRKRTNLDIYVLDLSDGSLVNLTPNSGIIDEDPKFSPDGSLIVWKREGQIWKMNVDGTSLTQLTSTADEKSGPNYSPDGSKIVYWSDVGSSADIWRINANGSGASILVANANLQDYYPIYRNNNNVLYSRWESTSDHHDKVYNVEVSSGVSMRLAVNVTGVEDADAAPVDTIYLLLSSKRAGGKGSYDVFVARYDNGGTYTLEDANSTHKDLGACYSPYTYARKLKVQAPASGATLTAGASYTLQVRAYSDGAIWSGTSPSVTFHGPTPQTYSDLRDDGTAGDAVSGDGIYSRTITLPASSGDYTITAGAHSVEPGVTRQVSSVPITATVMATGVPTVTTTAVSSITSNSAFSGGNVTSNGGASVTARGVCWSTSANPTTSDNHTSDGTGTGSFTSSITGLSPNTTYHVRAYATNSVGTGYGSEETFTTTGTAPPATTNVQATDGTYTDKVRITWSASSGATSYEVYRATSSGGTKSKIGTPSGTYYDDTSASVGTTYYYWVKAKNTYGTSEFSSHDTGYRVSCTYSISPTSQSFGSSGSSSSVSVTTQSGCYWTAVSNAGWITITSGSSGSGNGTVSYSVSANTGSSRTGTITIAGKSFTVTQSEVCYTLSTSVSPSGSGSVSKSPNKSCYYNEQVTIIASPNAGYEFDYWGGDLSGSTNPATITMNSSKSVTAYFKSCTYSISPTSKNFSSSGGSGTVNVTTQSGCSWTAVSNDGWITITSGSSGSGNGTVYYTVSANTGSSRTGTMSIAGKSFTVTQEGINVPPTANAGPDQTVDEGIRVTLDGSNSIDPDDGIVSYLWEQMVGISVILSDEKAIRPTFTSPEVGQDGESLTFQLTVTDNGGLQSTDTCIVNVTWENEPPTADAGPDQTVNEGDTVTLDASNSSDPDDGIASYQWTQTAGPPVTLSNPTAVQPTFIAPNVGPDGESLTFQLTVTDNGGLQATDTCIVNVTWENQPPTADAGSDQTVDESVTVTLDASNSTDPDDGIASYLWTQAAGTPVTLSDPTATKPTFVTPPVDLNGTTLTFQLTVEDNGGLESSDEVSVTINDNGITGFPDDVITFKSSTGENLGIKEESGGNLTSLSAVDPATIADTTDRPENLIYGLIDMQIKVAIAGDTATVTIYLPIAAPDGYKWYKYGPNKGWYDYSDNAVFNDARDQVTLTLIDGGIGDDDGIANGIIVDPSGLGSPPSTPPAPSDGGGGGGGCSIATAAFESSMEKHVTILKDFRDNYLLPSTMGRMFVNTYYKYSPAVAHFIEKHETLKGVVRMGLMPLVVISYFTIHFGPVTTLTMLA